MTDFLFNERDDAVDADDRSFDATDVADHPSDDASDYDPNDAPWVSQEDEARDDEMGAEFGDPRRCPRHPSVRTSSNDGMFDCDCYICEGEQDAAYEAHEARERAQFEFAHPIEAAIERTISMGDDARRESAREIWMEESRRDSAARVAREGDDEICF